MTQRLKTAVIHALEADHGRYCSGQRLAGMLGCSRNAVWKTIEDLRQQGYDIASVKNRGYCLRSFPDRLDGETIRQYLSAGDTGFTFLCHESVGSTNSLARQMAADGAGEGTVILADTQTAGRGRMGRTFHSPPGRGLWMSMILQPIMKPEEIMLLTVMAAEAVVEAVENTAGIRPGIKWTNDILVNGRKICGILTEMNMEAESGVIHQAVIGIGLNIGQAPEDFPEDIRERAASLRMVTGRTFRRAQLAAAVLHAFHRLYAAGSFRVTREALVDAYRKDLVMLGKQVRLTTASEVFDVMAVDIDDLGGLVVRDASGRVLVVRSGEVTLGP